MHEQVQPVGVKKGKDHLVKSGLPNVPNKPEGYDCGQGSMMPGGQLVLGHDFVEEGRGIEDPVKCFQQEQGYQNVLARKQPKVVECQDQQEGKTDRETPPTSSRFRGRIGRLRWPKVHQVVMSKEMRSV